MTNTTTIRHAINVWLETVEAARSKATYETYKIAMNAFMSSMINIPLSERRVLPPDDLAAQPAPGTGPTA